MSSSFDTPSRPLMEGLGRKTIEELISHESNIMVFKPLNPIVPGFFWSDHCPRGGGGNAPNYLQNHK